MVSFDKHVTYGYRDRSGALWGPYGSRPGFDAYEYVTGLSRTTGATPVRIVRHWNDQRTTVQVIRYGLSDREMVAAVCREHGLNVDWWDVRGGEADGLTIDGMPWKEWLSAMTGE